MRFSVGAGPVRVYGGGRRKAGASLGAGPVRIYGGGGRRRRKTNGIGWVVGVGVFAFFLTVGTLGVGAAVAIFGGLVALVTVAALVARRRTKNPKVREESWHGWS